MASSETPRAAGSESQVAYATSLPSASCARPTVVGTAGTPSGGPTERALPPKFGVQRRKGGRRPNPRAENHRGAGPGGIGQERGALTVPEVALVVHERERADPRPGVLLVDGRQRSDAARQWCVADEKQQAPEPSTEGDQENEGKQGDQGALRPLEEEQGDYESGRGEEDEPAEATGTGVAQLPPERTSDDNERESDCPGERQDRTAGHQPQKDIGNRNDHQRFLHRPLRSERNPNGRHDKHQDEHYVRLGQSRRGDKSARTPNMPV